LLNSPFVVRFVGSPVHRKSGFAEEFLSSRAVFLAFGWTGWVRIETWREENHPIARPENVTSTENRSGVAANTTPQGNSSWPAAERWLLCSWSESWSLRCWVT